MFCSSCGNKINNDDSFCYKCGAKINNNTIATNTTPLNNDEAKNQSIKEIMSNKAKIKDTISNLLSFIVVIVIIVFAIKGCVSCSEPKSKKEVKKVSSDKNKTEQHVEDKTKIIAKKNDSGAFYIRDIEITSDFSERTKNIGDFTSEIEVTYSDNKTNFILRHISDGGLVLGISFNNQNKIDLHESLIKYTNIYNSYKNNNGKSYVDIKNIVPLIFSEMANGLNFHDSISDNKSKIYFEDGLFVIKYFGTHEPFDSMFFIDYKNAIKLLKYSSNDWINKKISNTNKTEQRIEDKIIEKNWDGDALNGRISLEMILKENMNDPKSYKRSETLYYVDEKNSRIIVWIKYRGKNSFAAYVVGTIQADFYPNGMIISNITMPEYINNYGSDFGSPNKL